MREHGITPKKALGQHFLVSERIINAICEAVHQPGSILEIGPGPGVLTQRLTTLAQTHAIDLDPTVENLLKESAPSARFQLADVLKCDLKSALEELPEPRWIVSNLPYYISTAIIGRVLDVREFIAGCVLMMQREVGERLLAESGNSSRGSLSVSLQSRFQIEKISNVSASCFYPPPKVESIVLRLIPTEGDVPENLDEVLRLGFLHPRKTLANNLATKIGKENSEKLLMLGGLDLRIRPHFLTNAQWLDLAGQWNTLSS